MNQIIRSSWQIIFDQPSANRTLLDFGDWMSYEPSFPMSKGLEVVTIPGAPPFLRPNGGLFYTMKFGVFSTQNTNALAQEAILTSLIDIGPLLRKELRIYIEGRSGAYWKFTNSFITEHEPSMSIHPTLARLTKSYHITATNFSKVGA